MKRRLSLILLAFFLLTGFTHIPQGANETILNEAKQGQELIFQGKYREAQKLFNQLWRKYPDSPLGTFGLMALYNAIMFENYDFSLDRDFDQVSYANEQIVDKIAKNPNSSAWDNFLCGASAGLRGFYYIRLDKALKAMGQANVADKCIERALEKDPKFKDPLLGKGMSLYWRSVFTQSFSNILPFFKDHRPEGLKLMQQAVNEGMIANELARVSLMFAYLNDRKNRQGQKLAQELLQKYPDNVIAKLHLGRFKLNLGKPREALALFDEILAKHPNITVALYFKGRALYRMGKRSQAQALFEEFITKHKNPAWLAYAHYQLGHLALAQKDRKKAFYHFKKGYRTYGDFKPNLKMILKLRKQ